MPQPILLLHGALGARDTLRPIERALTPLLPAGTPVHAHEFAGHGTTPDPDAAPDAPYDVARLAAGVLEAMDRGRIDHAVLFGYSLGGYVALLLAAQHPTRVRAVTTLATKLAWTLEGAARETSRLDAATIRAKVPRFADALAARHADAGGWEAVLTRTAGMMHGIAARPLVTPEVLAAVACPTRICVGDRDATVTLDECVAAVRALPHGELAVLPGTGHPLEHADASRVAREILEMHARADVA
jgi:pimeloyl-ACP methyl ester carboxylesterase